MTAIDSSSFEAVGIQEREHLQAAIRDNPSILQNGELLIVSEEYSAFKDSSRRIDLLALDRDGYLVIIELKRTEDAGHAELQAVRYAGMVATMTLKDVATAYRLFLERRGKQELAAKADELVRDFICPPDDDVGDEADLRGTRIILAAADFSLEVTSTVLWLQKHKIDIRCVRLVPYRFEQHILVQAEQILPLPVAREYQVLVEHKNQVTAIAKEADRRRTAWFLSVDGVESRLENRRRLFAAVIRSLLAKGVAVDALVAATTPDLFFELEGSPSEEEVMVLLRNTRPSDGRMLDRYDWRKDQWLPGKPQRVLFNQNSGKHLPKLMSLAAKYHLSWREDKDLDLSSPETQ